MPKPPLMELNVTFNILVLTIGSLFNGTLLVIFIRERTMRTVANAYIVNLALTDLVLTIGFLPLFTVNILTGKWLFGDIVCKMVNFLGVGMLAVSVYTFSALSAERYYTICNILHLRSNSTCYLNKKHTTLITIISIWVFSCLLSIPYGINARVIEDSCVRVKYSEDATQYMRVAVRNALRGA
uniref:G-protein coupled receptors family 1 profile domain-containing protein n=1 Tax=Timema tahoe TaxID=61484 RepID=A0A7R9FK52_9NEOP|nr:unnamed protein product [Timema tahoe]